MKYQEDGLIKVSVKIKKPLYVRFDKKQKCSFSMTTTCDFREIQTCTVNCLL